MNHKIIRNPNRLRHFSLLFFKLTVLPILVMLLSITGCGSDEPHDDEVAEVPGREGIVEITSVAQQNIGLTTAAAERRPLIRTVKLTGIVEPNETRMAHIRPLGLGRIEQVNVRLGDRVRSGQLLLTYDNIELGELVGGYLKATAEIEVARRARERAEKLVELGAVARAELDRRDAEYQSALSEIGNVEEKLHRFGLTDEDLTQLNSSSHRDASHSSIRASFNGVVIAYDVAEGEVVDEEREVLTIADLSTVWVQADVYEKDIASIQEGQEVTVSVNTYPGTDFTGVITYVSDFLDPATRTAKVRCEVPNPDRKLKLQMFATIAIPSPTGQDAIMVPSTAVQQIDDKPVVFVQLTEGEFETREVQIGEQYAGWMEIKDGIREGERVATEGSFYVKSIAMRDEIEVDHDH